MITIQYHGKCHATRFTELAYRCVQPRTWRIVDVSREVCVGPAYTSRGELLADLERYATEFGCDGAKPRPLIDLRNTLVGAHHRDGTYSYYAGPGRFTECRDEALAMLSTHAQDVIDHLHQGAETGLYPHISYCQTLTSGPSNPRIA